MKRRSLFKLIAAAMVVPAALMRIPDPPKIESMPGIDPNAVIPWRIHAALVVPATLLRIPDPPKIASIQKKRTEAMFNMAERLEESFWGKVV